MKSLISVFAKIKSKMGCKLKEERGATMVEYALMVALIAVVAITAVTGIGTSVDTKFTEVSGAITNAAVE